MYSSRAAQSHIPQLDSLRALAILCVLFQHFYSGQYALGAIGVKLFFVLSGFLITGILLKAKGAIESGASTRGDSLRRFYARRFLRIMPLFYLVLMLIAILNLPGVREQFYWHAGYLSNVYFARAGAWSGVAGPYWSLSVEEQFYLLWPCVILITPRRLLPAMLCAVVFLGVYFCLIAPAFGFSEIAIYVLPFTSFMQLGAGALLALVLDERYGLNRFARAFERIGLGLGGPLLIFTVLKHHIGGIDQSPTFLLNVSIMLFGAGLISRAAKGKNDVLGKLLSTRALRYIGTISYGIYILNLPVREIATEYLPHVNDLTDALVQAVLTVALAALSWHFFEAPINRLKRHFDYPQALTRADVISTIAAPRSSATGDVPHAGAF